MKGKVFIDTNLWIYLYSNEKKGFAIKSLVDEHFQDVTVTMHAGTA